jgi:ABC-type sugar transport system ATPase subunit
MEPLLKVARISKTFGTLSALQQISFEVYPGEVVGLAGRSGAGKSVLAMLLAGLQSPTEGELHFAGQRLNWPFQARDLGIAVIHQEPVLADNLDITSNIFLGSELGWSLFGRRIVIPDRRRMDAEAVRLLAQLEVGFPNLYEKVTNLSSEQRQLVAIARAMARPAKLIVVDEPTMLLSYSRQKH